MTIITITIIIIVIIIDWYNKTFENIRAIGLSLSVLIEASEKSQA